MKRISSRYLFVFKRIFPLVWFGFLATILGTGALTSSAQAPLMVFVAPIAMAVFGYFLMKKLIWDLVGEVWDGGDFLLVKNGGKEDSIPLVNIMNVSAALLTSPRRVTLRLTSPCQFGSEINFLPASSFSLNPFAKNAVVEDLIERAYRARAQRAV